MLIIKDYKWNQNEDEIFIQIPMKNSTSNADILTSEKFVKLNAPPYYFEVFLLHSIVEEESRCQLTRNEARFYLKKVENIEWESLERQFQSKNEKLQFKQQILREIESKLSERSKIKLQMKEEIKKSQIEKTMEKDAEKREIIEKFKKSIIEMEVPKVEEIKNVESKMNLYPTTSSSSSSSSTSSNHAHHIEIETKKKEETMKPEMPKIRKSAHIEIEFSKRNFVTPKRESQNLAEQEWIMKQNAARRATVGFIEEDLLPEERDPMYLKTKGDDFFTKCNYLAAISAYSTGIRMAGKCYELYLNRSAAHYALGNYQRCAEDCTKALELLHPPVEMNLKARKKAFARRGASLYQLGFLHEAYGEFVAAVKLDPEDETLRNDADLLKAKLDYTSDE
jgi:dyslexia susceptibility 1 candidate gene 1 protein